MEGTLSITDEENTTVTFSATGTDDDYGVPGSPTFTSIDDVTITSIEYEDGATLIGKEITAELHNKYIGLADAGEFIFSEPDSYDYDDRDYDN